MLSMSNAKRSRSVIIWFFFYKKYKYVFPMTKYLILFQIIYYLLRQFVQVIPWLAGA
jgi:hypothetical protein